MKKLALLLFVSAAAFAEEYPNYKINVDWKDPQSLRDNVVQQCDDSYYPAVEIKIPGKGPKDFSVEMISDVTSGSNTPGCSLKRRTNGSSTTYIVDADNGGCTIRVTKDYKPGEELKTAVYEIYDAC